MYQSILLSNVRVLLYLVNAFHLYVHFAGERHIKDIHFVCQHNKRGTSSALTVWNDRDISNSCIQINMPPARYTQPPASTSTTLRQVVSVIVQFFRASAKCKKRARTCKRPITQKRIRVRVGWKGGQILCTTISSNEIIRIRWSGNKHRSSLYQNYIVNLLELYTMKIVLAIQQQETKDESMLCRVPPPDILQ